MFQGKMFRLNMFVIALFTSDAGFKHVPCMVVNFGFALRCCALVIVVIKACSNALDFVYHTTFDLYTLQSRVRLNTLYSAHYTRFDKSNGV